MVEFTDGPSGDLTVATARLLGDAMLSLTNLPPMGPHWRQVDPTRAREIMAAVLYEDLQAETNQVPRKVAYRLADRMLAQFQDNAIYLSNVKPTADLTNDSPHSWASGRMGRELDAGVVIVNESLVGLLWVEDRP